MILVDTSVWIAIIRGEISLDEDDYEEFYTCGPVVQEVLQGFDDNSLTAQYSRYFLDIPRLSDPLPSKLFVSAAEI
jgi:predicted nucleic acid-binding protein